NPQIRQWCVICDRRLVYCFHRCPILFWRYSMVNIPDDLLDLQSRVVQWRANRKYIREPIPELLRDAALEMSRRYPPSLVRRVVELQLCPLTQKEKTNARRSKRQQPQTPFFKFQPQAASLGAESLTPQSSTPQSSTDCRVQLERPDGARLSLTLPSLDAVAL